MRMKKIINFVAVFLLAIFTFSLSINAGSTSYYVVGGFNNYKQDSSTMMSLREEGIYEYTLDNNTSNIQMAITDGVNYYRTGGLNKGSNFLIKEKGKYEITLNTTKETDNVTIKKLPEPSYYVLGSTGITPSDELKMSFVDRGKYEYTIDAKENTLIYISDGTTDYRDINGDDYFIKNAGKYKLSFTVSERAHHLTITPISDIEYYFISNLNNYEISADYRMEMGDGEYYFDIEATSYVSFYIGNEDESYKNGLVEYILEGMKSYRVHFKPVDKSVTIEELNYYILNEENNYQINENYKLERNLDVTSYLEYTYLVDVKKPYQFLIGSKYTTFDNNGGSFIIDKDGKYNILFSNNHLYNGSKVSYVPTKRPSNKYYVVGTFNEYELNDEYLMKYNTESLDYNEFTIDLTLAKGDSFYIKNDDISYYAPDGNEIVAPYNGDYRIYFSKDYDYGNGYHISYKLIHNSETEPRTIIIETKEDLVKLINECNLDSYSNNLVVELRSDLNMEGAVIKPIAIFSGIFNANFHRIYNFKLDNSNLGSEFGFINILLEGAEVNNLILEYGLELKDKDIALGGIAGRNYGTIRNSSYTGRLSGKGITGGIVGVNEENALVYGSSSNGEVISRAFVGGIVGLNNGEIKECINNAKINNTSFSSADEGKVSNIGGIAGYNSGSVLKSKNNASIGYNKVKLGIFIGGIAGASVGTISECHNASDVYGKSYIGGICGYFSEINSNNGNKLYEDIIKEIEGILNGNKEDTTYKGNKLEGKILYSYNSGTINGNDRIGGITGLQANEALNKEFKLEGNYNIGNINASGSYAGGIAGESLKADIINCFNTGVITATNSYAGGIAGSSLGNIIASFNNASIKAKDHAGGIAGYAVGLNNCYSISLLDVKEGFIGGLAGEVKEVSDKLFDNFYISNGFKAFSNVDYENKGMETKRDVLASKGILNIGLSFKYYEAGDSELSYPRLKLMNSYDGYLKDDFKRDIKEATSYSCNITFIDENNDIIRIDRVIYNEDYDLSRLPEVPKKDGYIVKWDPSFTGKAIKDDVIVKAVYDEIITSIASSSGNKPTAILEGNFFKDTVFDIAETNNNYLGSDSTYKMLSSYSISIKDGSNNINKDNLIISVRASSNKNTAIAIIKDGSLVLVPYEVNGDYLRFELSGATEFMVLEKVYFNINNEAFIKTVSYSGIALAAVVVIAAGAVVLINSKKRKNI